MDQRSPRMPRDDGLSPYRIFSRDEWANLRADTPMTLTADEVLRLQSLNDPISLDEVVAIYLPLSRLLSLYVAATQGLFKATQRFLLAENEVKVPYIIGIAGSVAVGKSTTARVLKALLARWPNTPKVDLVTTDGFLSAQRRARAPRPDGAQGLSGELRHRRRCCASSPTSRPASASRGAGLFAPRLRRGAGRGDGGRPARHPDRRGAQRAAAGAAAEGRHGDPVRLRLLRLLGLSSTPTRTTCTAGT